MENLYWPLPVNHEYTVYEDQEHINTGLLDAKGRKIFRPRMQTIGFKRENSQLSVKNSG